MTHQQSQLTGNEERRLSKGPIGPSAQRWHATQQAASPIATKMLRCQSCGAPTHARAPGLHRLTVSRRQTANLSENTQMGRRRVKMTGKTCSSHTHPRHLRSEHLSGSDRSCLAAAAWSLTETDGASLRNVSRSEQPRPNFHRKRSEMGDSHNWGGSEVSEEKPEMISGVGKIVPSTKRQRRMSPSTGRTG